MLSTKEMEKETIERNGIVSDVGDRGSLLWNIPTLLNNFSVKGWSPYIMEELLNCMDSTSLIDT
jgi:hypothetical protein